MPKPGVMLYFDVRTCLKRLTTEQKGQLFEAILDYGEHRVEPEFGDDIGLTIAWDFIRHMVDRDDNRYSDISKKRSEAATKRWEKERANAHRNMQADADSANAYSTMQMDANAQNPVHFRGYEQKSSDEHPENLHEAMQMHNTECKPMQTMPTTTTTTSTPTPTTPSTATTTTATTTPPLTQAPKNPASQVDFEKMRRQKIEMLTQQRR